MQTITRDQIIAVLPQLDLLPIIEEGFRAYSAGDAVVPPVGELLLDKGEVHIKYGYLKGGSYYVIKIASGFFANPKIGLPTGNGLMLLFNQDTGEPVSILQDEGYLTDVRTAIAGAIAAKYLAPSEVERIGIVGTGVQARLQLEYLKSVTPCRKVLVWGRGSEQLARYQQDMASQGYSVEVTPDSGAVLQSCNLIVTTTPAREPLLASANLQPGTQITAMGSDTLQKQELEPEILQVADLVVADSISQCLVRGEIHHALDSGHIAQGDIIELGNIIAGNSAGRTAPDQITIADLTGVAVQDIQIATAVYEALA
ncbi:MAG: ornithine cyclodeaminase family protein [Fidelibacterota bacterium]|nr:MAG: ornithine cyclodeaminase family protein [Candidatus Neomarinimicrobiota bacterium]